MPQPERRGDVVRSGPELDVVGDFLVQGEVVPVVQHGDGGNQQRRRGIPGTAQHRAADSAELRCRSRARSAFETRGAGVGRLRPGAPHVRAVRRRGCSAMDLGGPHVVVGSPAFLTGYLVTGAVLRDRARRRPVATRRAAARRADHPPPVVRSRRSHRSALGVLQPRHDRAPGTARRRTRPGLRPGGATAVGRSLGAVVRGRDRLAPLRTSRAPGSPAAPRRSDQSTGVPNKGVERVIRGQPHPKCDSAHAA